MTTQEETEALEAARRILDTKSGVWFNGADAVKVANFLLSSSAAARGMREALALVDKGFRSKRLKDASVIIGGDVKALSEIVSATLSPNRPLAGEEK